jgi:hypothetical protein
MLAALRHIVALIAPPPAGVAGHPRTRLLPSPRGESVTPGMDADEQQSHHKQPNKEHEQP